MRAPVIGSEDGDGERVGYRHDTRRAASVDQSPFEMERRAREGRRRGDRSREDAMAGAADSGGTREHERRSDLEGDAAEPCVAAAADREGRRRARDEQVPGGSAETATDADSERGVAERRGPAGGGDLRREAARAGARG